MEDTESQVILSLRRNVLWSSFAVVAIGLAVMVGWGADVPLLKSILPNYVAMKFNTAFCFVLAGAALWCQQRAGTAWRRLGKILAIVVVAIGALTLFEYLLGWDAGIDNLFIQEPAGAVATVALGRMSSMTAAGFVLVGLSLLPVHTQMGWRLLSSQVSALVVTLLSLRVLLGYLYGDASLYTPGLNIPVALHTAIAFMILSLGVISTRPHCYLLRDITSDASGGVMARRLLPFALLVPIAVGWIHLNWSMELRMGESLEALTIILILAALIWYLAGTLNVMDVERHRNKEEQRASDLRLRLVGRVLNDAVMDWDLMSNEVWYSESFYTFFGYSPKKPETTIAFWQEGIHPDDKARTVLEMKKFVGNGQEICSCEYRFRRKNGAYANILGRGYLVRDGAGRAIHMVCAMIDMTQHKKREEIEREREMMESRYKFISMVSHELRSPMTVIQSGIEMISDGTDGPVTHEQKQHLDMVHHHIDRLNRLVSNVLDFQKLETGRMPFHESLLDINSVVGNVANDFQTEAKKKGMQVELHLSSDIPKVVCDKDGLEQVMTNLLSNAIKYSQNGHVDVATARDGNALRVTVHDEGIGIQKQDQAKLFQSFHRIYNERASRTEGTGLGLAICKKIVEAYHGQIGVTSEFGHGATFYFTLPIQKG